MTSYIAHIGSTPVPTASWSSCGGMLRVLALGVLCIGIELSSNQGCILGGFGAMGPAVTKGALKKRRKKKRERKKEKEKGKKETKKRKDR